VGLGTDSPASAPSLDAFEELRAALLTARARAERPDALTPREALELATLGSARAMGLGAEIGSLAPGKRADLTVLDLSDSGYVPWEDPAAAVVFGGSPERIHATLVDGDFRYVRGEERQWLEELRSSARLARGRMLRGAEVHAPATRR
jgi:5-methylthioadenosine/S-adenosylhomocysteine deaminase